MNNLNQILIEGNLTRDPVLKKTPKGTSICTFSVASNRYHKNEGSEEFAQEVSFFDITAWQELADKCAKELTNGRGVRVIGRLKQDRWTDKETQQGRSKIYIIAEHVVFKPENKKGEKPIPVADHEDDGEIPF